MKFKMPPVDMRSARHVQMMLAGFAAIFLLGLAFATSHANAVGARNALTGFCGYIVLISFIEWRIHVDGFDHVCRAAKRLSKERRKALIDLLSSMD